LRFQLHENALDLTELNTW